ncbi:MAG: hypothetical protein AAF492_06750, partial [Verrucomicrobiota bacterium]
MMDRDVLNFELLPRLRVIAFILAGFFMSVLVGMLIGKGNAKVALMIFGAFAITYLTLNLKNKAWILVVFAMCTAIPVITVGFRTLYLAEIVVSGIAVLALMRVALKVDQMRIFRVEMVAILLYMSWVIVVMILNPVGMLVFGSETGGARYYFQLALGFIACVYMANQKFSDRDCKWIIMIMIGGSILTVVQAFVRHKFFGEEVVAEASFYSWHASMSPMAFLIVLFIFVRYGLNRVLSLT